MQRSNVKMTRFKSPLATVVFWYKNNCCMSSHKMYCRWPAVTSSRCGGWVRARMRAMQESACQPGRGRKGRLSCRLWVSLRGSLPLTGLLGLCREFFPQKRKLKTAFFALNSCCQKTHSAASSTHYYSQLSISPTRCFATLCAPT